MENEKIPLHYIQARYDVSYRNDREHSPILEGCVQTCEQIQILYLRSGRCSVQLEESHYSLESGNMILIHEWQPHKIVCSDNGCECTLISFDLYTLESLKQIPHLKTDMVHCFHELKKNNNIVSVTGRAQKELEELLEKYRAHRGFGFDIKRFSTMLELIMLCYEQFKNNAPLHLDHLKKESISEMAINYITCHFLENITVLDVANHLFLNKKYLGGVFKKETGFTVKEYIAFRRITEARAILQTEGKNVHDAFCASGFQDYSGFFRYFKTIMGVTPSEYRRIYLESKVCPDVKLPQPYLGQRDSCP